MAGAKERYDQLSTARDQFLQRARHNAMLTIPALMPLVGHDGKAHLIEPYQSLGATGVTSMSSRMTMALLPAGRPHLRLGVPPAMLLAMKGEVPVEMQKNLAKAEKLVQHSVERANWRADTLQIVQQLIVAGSVTEETLDDDTIRIHRLDNFVWRRDFRGKMIECVLREFWDVHALPEGVSKPEAQVNTTSISDRRAEDVEVFTHIVLKRGEKDGEFYEVTQQTEVGSTIGETKQFKPDALRYRFLRWAATPGEDYGRSKVEEMVADLRSLDSMSKQSLEQGAMAAKNFVMVRPGATANGLKNRISRINNGDVVLGDPEGVELKQFASPGGFQITDAMVSKLEERIAAAFLLLGATQRNAERVTATEIERDIQELESTLGGVFSALSLEMLEKRTALLIEDMKVKGEFPEIGKDELQVTILTGLEALSRERDVGRGVQAAQIASQFGEQGLAFLKMDVLLGAIMVGLGFPDAVKTQAEVSAAQQKQQEAALAEKAVGPGIQAAGKIAQQQGGEGGQAK